MKTEKLSYIARSLYNNQLFGWLKTPEGQMLCYYWEDGWKLATHRIQYNSKDFQIISFNEFRNSLAQKENTEMTTIEEEMRENVVEIFGESKDAINEEMRNILEEVLQLKWETRKVSSFYNADHELTYKVEGFVIDEVITLVDVLRSKYPKYQIHFQFIADRKQQSLNVLKWAIYDEVVVTIRRKREGMFAA